MPRAIFKRIASPIRLLNFRKAFLLIIIRIFPITPPKVPQA